MKRLSFLPLAAVLVLVVGCQKNETPAPNGAGYRHEAPTDVVSLLAENTFPLAKRVARRCESGDFQSCHRLAGWLAYGKEVPPEEQSGDHAGEATLQKDHGETVAAVGHGERPAEQPQPVGSEADAERADEDADIDDSHEIAHSDVHVHDYAGIAPQPEKAVGLFEVTCNAGWDDACVELVRLSSQGHVELTNAKRGEYLQDACRQRSYRACVLLAELANTGRVDVSKDKAAESVEFACQNAYAPACDFFDANPDYRAIPLPGQAFNFLFEVASTADGARVRAILPSQAMASAVRASIKNVLNAEKTDVQLKVDTAMMDPSWVQTVPALLTLFNELSGKSVRVRLDNNELSVSGGVPENAKFVTTIVKSVEPQLHGRTVNVEFGESVDGDRSAEAEGNDNDSSQTPEAPTPAQ